MGGQLKCAGCGHPFSDSDLEVMESHELVEPIFCDLCASESEPTHKFIN
jgi:hypothetical protein